MGRFIVSRNASGVRFLLESDKGRTLAVSKEYATLDAAKKGICSLVYYAPIVPLVDATVGERAPNPKIEIFKENDSFAFAVKSANGKSVITAAGFATRKACLRAVSMLRTGVMGADVVFSNPAGLIPLTVGAMVRDPVPEAVATDKAAAPVMAFAPEPLLEAADEPAVDFFEEDASAKDFASIPAEVSLSPRAAAPATPSVTTPNAAKAAPAVPRVPRRVTLKGEGTIVRQPTEGQPQKPHTIPQEKGRKSSVLSRFFKR